jgi:30S ribosomal protein S31
MGKGDKRSKKGKIFRGSFGKRRPGKRKVAAKKGAKGGAKR